MRYKSDGTFTEHRLSDVFDRLPATKPQLDRVAAAPPTISEASDCVGYTFDGEKSGRSEVVGLLRACCPSAIFRSVVAVWVDAVNRYRFVRLLTHIFKKVFKRVDPPFAHSNAPSSIYGKVTYSWVVAPLFHARPSLILRRSSFPMSLVACQHRLLQKAATGGCVPAGQFPGRHGGFVPAFANTQPAPYWSPVGVRSWFAERLNCQATKPLANQIQWLPHAQ